MFNSMEGECEKCLLATLCRLIKNYIAWTSRYTNTTLTITWCYKRSTCCQKPGHMSRLYTVTLITSSMLPILRVNYSQHRLKHILASCFYNCEKFDKLYWLSRHLEIWSADKPLKCKCVVFLVTGCWPKDSFFQVCSFILHKGFCVTLSVLHYVYTCQLYTCFVYCFGDISV